MSVESNNIIDSVFWYYEIGVNCIPFDSKNKTTNIKWSIWQDQSIQDEIYQIWKKNRLFNKGIAIISGKIWRGHNKAKYLVCIDIDNKEGLDRFLSHFEEFDSLAKLSRKTLIEQHKDDLERAHIYFISEIPLIKRSRFGETNQNASKISSGAIPAIEVKSEGKHGVIIVSPSIHKNGYLYEIIGTTKPTTLNLEQSNKLEDTLKKICEGDNGNRIRHENNQIHIEDLFKDNFEIYEGNNRHGYLLRAMESLIQRYKNILSEKRIIKLSQEWNQDHCRPPLDEKEFEKQWKDAKSFISRMQGQQSNAVTSNCDSRMQQKSDATLYELKSKLFEKISDKDIIEYLIRTLQKTVKRENSLIRLILYTCLSTFTSDPLNLGIVAPTSEGKTYAVTEVVKLVPKQNIWMIGNMFPKVLIREKGILVDKNNQPIHDRVTELKSKIQVEKDEKNRDELKEQLMSLYENSKVLIDLSNMILIFLEPPHLETWAILKPILSHDTLEIEHPYVYKTETKGLEVKHIVTRGWPACIFCSAKDDSSRSMWPEIQSRFFIASPNMVKQKYQDSNALIAQKKGLPVLVHEQLIISKEDLELAKDCILLLKEKLLSNYSNNVWIPFQSILSESLPSEKGPDVRIADRIFSMLVLITKVNSFNRPSLVYGEEILAIAQLSDLEEALKLIHNITGIPSYKVDFLTEIFLPLYLSKKEPLQKDDKSEERIAVYTNELSDYFKKIKGKSLTTDAIKKTYLIELKNNGLVDDFQSEVDKRKSGYYPIIDVSHFNSTAKIANEKYRNYSNLSDNDNKLQFFKLNLPNNFINVGENWLELQIFDLIKYGIGRANMFKLLDKEGNQTYICRFVKEYNKFGSLSRYFQSAENCIYISKIFGEEENYKMQKIINKNYNKLSKFVYYLFFDID